MNCIICNEPANAKGSHIVPASLIQNCVGKHYAEESYEIDTSNANIDVYYGRDNLKNTDPKLKQHHYKRDDLLCQCCEKKLGQIESEFSAEFLQKFRNEKFKQNFKCYQLESGLEIIEPNKLTNLKIQAYIYSIILRYCRTEEALIIQNESDLSRIKSFLCGFLYEKQDDYINSISEFNLIITFDKHSTKGSFVFALEEYTNPYTFYFCGAIVQLFTKKDKIPEGLKGCLNTIEEEKAKIIVGPSEFFKAIMIPAQEILMHSTGSSL